MPEFTYQFVVDAPQEQVRAFHHSSLALKKLTPPMMFPRFHRVDPLGEGSISEFTLWLGPIPIRWRAVHSDVGPHGFTDTQAAGPAATWQHTHSFTPLAPARTRVDEHIVYTHKRGLPGLLTRFLFARINLTLLFAYRAWATRRALARMGPAAAAGEERAADG